MKSKRHRSPRNDTQKCVRILAENRIVRFSAAIAARYVMDGAAVYVPKRLLKEQKANESK